MTTTIPPTTAVAARAVQASKIYGKGETEVRALDDVDVEFGTRAVHRDHGPLGLRQVDAAALHRRPRHAHERAGVPRRHRDQRARARSSSRRCAATRSASSSRRTTSSRRSPRSRTSRCRWRSRAAKPDQEWLDHVDRHRRLARPAEAPAVGALRRPAAARRRCPRPREPARDHLRRRTDRQPRLQASAEILTFMRKRSTSSARRS